MISWRRTIFGSGFGIWIPTVSVPGIGATILNDLDFKDNLISFVNDSILEIATHASGLILICTTDGHKSNHSIVTGTLNSNNLSWSDLAFSTKNLSFIDELEFPGFSNDVLNVGLSHENLIVGLFTGSGVVDTLVGLAGVLFPMKSKIDPVFHVLLTVAGFSV
jgi:hypothetical protein